MTRRLAARSERGYSLTELLVVISIIGIMALIAVPLVMTYIPGATVNYAAREVQGSLNRAKLLAVATRQSICVQVVAGGYRFVQVSCGGTVWTGPGTNGAGTFTMGGGLTITNAGTSPVFNQFGMATTTGTFSISATGAAPVTVSVNTAGRVTIP